MGKPDYLKSKKGN